MGFYEFKILKKILENEIIKCIISFSESFEIVTWEKNKRGKMGIILWYGDHLLLSWRIKNRWVDWIIKFDWVACDI